MKAIFYASSTGNTEDVANKIHAKLDGFEIFDIANDGIENINDCSTVIIGTPTWGEGELQDDWEDCFEDLKEIDFSGKTVALFGLGDQDNYGDEFVNALGTMHEAVVNAGAKVVGYTSTDGYDFEVSEALVDGQFVGLVIDEDNQDDLTDERIDNWCEAIKDSL